MWLLNQARRNAGSITREFAEDEDVQSWDGNASFFDGNSHWTLCGMILTCSNAAGLPHGAMGSRRASIDEASEMSACKVPTFESVDEELVWYKAELRRSNEVCNAEMQALRAYYRDKLNDKNAEIGYFLALAPPSSPHMF